MFTAFEIWTLLDTASVWMTAWQVYGIAFLWLLTSSLLSTGWKLLILISCCRHVSKLSNFGLEFSFCEGSETGPPDYVLTVQILLVKWLLASLDGFFCIVATIRGRKNREYCCCCLVIGSIGGSFSLLINCFCTDRRFVEVETLCRFSEYLCPTSLLPEI